MSRLRILVVEDDTLIGELLTELLTEMGYDVGGVATTQRGAVVAASLERPDLMIVDVNLAQGNGLDAMDDVLRQGPMAHIIMSNELCEHDRAGAVILKKPFAISALAHAIERAVRPPQAC